LRWTTEKKSVNFLRSVAAGAAGSPLAFTDPAAWWRSSLNKPATPSVTLDKTKSWSDWTYDLTPEYEITDNLRVYAKYAKGFRSGGYNTGATSQLAVSGDYEVVKPEYLTSVELGVKSEWFNERLTANATVFQYDYDDIQVNVVGVAPGSQGQSVSLLQNVKEGKASGAEFDIESLPFENLHVNLSLGLLNTKFTDFDVQTSADTVVDYSGNRFVRSPKKSAVFGFDYDIPLGSAGKIVVGSDLKYQSKQYYFTTNQDNPRLAQDGYTLANARVAYKTADDALTYTAYVNNLSDKKYLNHALPGTAGSFGDTSIWGEPRTFGLSVAANWK
jgi:iron complex outermembrane receptor protein